MADSGVDCSGYSGGSLAGAIIGTFAATLLLLGLIYLVWEWQKKRRIKRSGLHNLVIVEDGGGSASDTTEGKVFAYDNPGFIDESSEAKKARESGGLDAKFNGTGKPVSQQNGGKKMPWGPLSFLFKSRNALDDSVVEEPQKYNVALKGHDFTGLGFNICGNMRDGIFVKDIMQRGPAAESNQVLPGDQITAMTVSFRQMVLEDAITLLSYASPYEVSLDMLRLPEKSLPHKGIFMSSPTHPSSASAGQSNTLERVCHPFFKSQSIDDLRKVGKEHLDLQVDRKKKQANGVHSSSKTVIASPSPTVGTMELPTVVVVGNNENRSSPSKSPVKLPKLPKLNFSLGSSSNASSPSKSKKAPEASHQPSSSSDIKIPMPDQVDSPKKLGAAVTIAKPEVVPRTKTKQINVQKSAASLPDDMELVEAISPAIEQMTAEFERSKKMTIDKKLEASAVLDVQPVQIDMSGQPSVQVESTKSLEIDLPKAEVDLRAPSMIMPSVDKSDKDAKKKDKKQKGSGKDIDITLPSFSLKAGGKVDKGESGDQAETAPAQRTKKSKDKTEKVKETKKLDAAAAVKESKKPEKEEKEKESSDQPGGVEASGEKSKFFKFGIPVLPDISLNFGFGGNNKGSSGEDKEEKEVKEKPVTEQSKELTEKVAPVVAESPKKVDKKKEKSPEPEQVKEKKKDEKKEKEAKDKAAKSKDKKDKEEKEMASKMAASVGKSNEDQSEPSGKEVKESPTTKEKSGSSFSFNIKLPSFDKPLLKRKDSSSSTSGEASADLVIDGSPNAAVPRSKESPGEGKLRQDKTSEPSPGKSKKKKEKKEKKESSRPTSPEISEGHRTTDDEAEKSMDVVDFSVPGEKSKKGGGGGGGFHMPHLGLKLPKFGHSKQTYSFENAGDNKDLKHSHGPTAEALLEGSPSVSLEVSANTPEFKKMTPTPDEIIPEVAVKVPEMQVVQVVTKNAKDVVDSGDVKVQVDTPKELMSAPIMSIPTASVKVEMEKASSSGPVVPEVKSDAVHESMKQEDQTAKDKEGKPSFVSKGLKGLRDFKDKVAHKLSHDHTQNAMSSSSEDEGEPGEDKVTKEKTKKEKKTKEKESREKAKEEKQREKEEKAKEKEKLKAEKKLKKAEQKKLKSAAAQSSSSSSSSSSSDESDADEGKEKKKKLKVKEKASKEKKLKKDKKGEKSDKKLAAGIEVKAELPSVTLQAPEMTLTADQQKQQMSAHEAKLIPAKPPVVPRKSRDSLDDSVVKVSQEVGKQKGNLKKTKSSKGASTSSSSSSSESDSENNRKDDKPKKPKRTHKRKAPEIPTVSCDVPDIVKITTSAEVITPPREEIGKKESEMRESTPSKTPESGRRSASFGDLSSLNQPRSSGDGPLERAMSLDMGGDPENSNQQGAMSVGSSQDDLSAVPDSKTITHLTRGQQQQQMTQRESITSQVSSSNEALTAVIQVYPKGQHELIQVTSTDLSQPAPAGLTVSSSSNAEPDSSTAQKMMSETLSVMNNIVHEMGSPSLVKFAMSSAAGNVSEPSQVTRASSSSHPSTPMDVSEAEKVAQETVNNIVAKASQMVLPELSIKVPEDQVAKVSVTTGDCSSSEPVTHSLSADMEGGADSFSIASVKIHSPGENGDSEEPISVRNITVTNIKSDPKTDAADDDANSSDSGKPLMKREDSKARLLQTVADANEIKVAPATPLRRDSSLSSSSCSVDSASDKPEGPIKPNFSVVTSSAEKSEPVPNGNGKTIEISSQELDGIMMSHADFLQKTASSVGSSLDEPDDLHGQLKDTFDNWVYVEQKNAAHEHTCPHSSHSDPEPSTSSSNDDDDGPYSRNGALSPTTYRMETEYKFETSEMRVTSSPLPPEEAHLKSQSTVYSTTMTLPQKTVTQITLGDPVVEAGARIVSKITLDTTTPGSEENVNKTTGNTNVELPKLESLK